MKLLKLSRLDHFEYLRHDGRLRRVNLLWRHVGPKHRPDRGVAALFHWFLLSARSSNLGVFDDDADTRIQCSAGRASFLHDR